MQIKDRIISFQFCMISYHLFSSVEEMSSYSEAACAAPLWRWERHAVKSIDHTQMDRTFKN